MVVLPSFPLKLVQSFVATHPACKLLATAHDKLLPANERPLPIEADVTGLVPFPVSNPPSVVEPVPPKLTASAVLPTPLPVEAVVRMEEGIEGNHTEERKA